MKTLNIVGCGRVGKTLAHLWHQHGALQVQDIVTRSAVSADVAVAFIGVGRACGTVAEMRPADLWMLAVPDAALAEVAQQLYDQLQGSSPKCSTDQDTNGVLGAIAAAPAHLPDSTTAPPTQTLSKRPVSSPDLASRGMQSAPPIAFHCSGALGSDLLAPLQALGWHTASAHCLLSFATPQIAVAQFAGTACALEGDAVARTVLEPLLTAIGAQCFALQSDQKLLYHAAAVFATNFLPVLQSVAEDLWRDTGVPAEMIHALRASLLANAVSNITALGPRKALTGPAARGDVAAIARQGAAVTEWSDDAGTAYLALSQLALDMARTAKG